MPAQTQPREEISALQMAYTERYGSPLGSLETDDPQLKASANMSAPGTAPEQPEISAVQQHIGQQADAPIPAPGQAPVPGDDQQKMGGNNSAAFIADVIRHLSSQPDQAPALASAISGAPLPPVI